MRISYDSEEIRDLCEDENYTVSKFGEDVANIIFSRLDDIASASDPSELIVGNPCEINIDNIRYYKVDINTELEIIFVPALPSTPSLKWENINRIKILKVGL